MLSDLCGLVISSLLVAACGSTAEDESAGQTAGSGGIVSTGGVAAGGSPTTGGAASGGSASGGTGTGGGTGGTVPQVGGSSSGGATGTGGAGTGGSGAGGTGGATGGASSGGATGTGGASTVTCPAQSLSPGDSTRTITVGGKSRTYVLHVPSSYDGDAPAPLVVDFHPLGGSGPNERSGSPYPAQTDPDGVIMAFPSGLSGPSGGAWNVGPCCVANTDDVAFARALVEDIQTTACIDPKRIYAVGFSMGGGMSHYLACHAADLFAAVAPAAFDLLEENVDDCTPSRPISVVSFRGTSDPVVPYAGGYSAVVSGMPVNFLGAEATFQAWAQKNQCSGSPSAKDSNGCSKYSGCAGGVDVVLCTQQGGSHSPGNASVGWPILKQHVLP